LESVGLGLRSPPRSETNVACRDGRRRGPVKVSPVAPAGSSLPDI